MGEAELICNLLICREKLRDQAFVTSCCHIFCDKHDQDLFKHKECPACGTKFSHEYDFVQIDLNPSEQYKSIVLTGLNPDIVMEIATRAMSFFIYQMKYSNDNTMKHLKHQNEELKKYYSSMKSKFLIDLKKCQETIANLKAELADKSKCIEKQRLQIDYWKKTHRKLQIESFKREHSKRKVQDNLSFSPVRDVSPERQRSGLDFLDKPYGSQFSSFH